MGDPEEHSNYELLPCVLSIVTLIWYAFIWVLGILGCLTGRKRYRLRPRSPLASAVPETVPGVSILRPLKGLDTNLFENLESTFTQEYPKYEIILSVPDENDQALLVVRDLLAKYATVDTKVVIGEEVVGVNPKVNNLIRSYNQAKYDILWVLDSNVLVAPGTLARSVDAFVGPPSPSGSSSRTIPRRVGLVHHVPVAFASERGLGSRIEEAFLNTNHARMYLAINRLAIDSCVVGKSNMYRRSDLQQVNGNLKPPSEERAVHGSKGMAAFGRFLAEDNMIASALWHELGLRHELSCDTAGNTVGSMSFSAYVWRRVRWIRVRKHMVTAATLVEPFTECIVLSLLAAWALRRLFTVPPWLFFAAHYPLWITLDLDVYESITGDSLLTSRRWSFLGAWALRELLALPIWILSMLGDQVEWRGEIYKLMKNGEVTRHSASVWSDWWLLLRFRATKFYESLDSEEDGR